MLAESAPPIMPTLKPIAKHSAAGFTTNFCPSRSILRFSLCHITARGTYTLMLAVCLRGKGSQIPAPHRTNKHPIGIINVSPTKWQGSDTKLTKRCGNERGSTPTGRCFAVDRDTRRRKNGVTRHAPGTRNAIRGGKEKPGSGGTRCPPRIRAGRDHAVWMQGHLALARRGRPRPRWPRAPLQVETTSRGVCTAASRHGGGWRGPGLSPRPPIAVSTSYFRRPGWPGRPPGRGVARGATMRAAVLEEVPGEFIIEDVTVDAPGPREVLVRTAAAGVCHSDLHFMEGLYPWPDADGSRSRVGRGGRGSRTRRHLRLGRRPRDLLRVDLLRGVRALPDRSALPLRQPLGPPRWRRARRASRRRGETVWQFADLGSFAEQLLVHERALVKIPHDVPLDRAALLGCGVLTGRRSGLPDRGRWNRHRRSSSWAAAASA